jgi:hypothetical protein
MSCESLKELPALVIEARRGGCVDEMTKESGKKKLLQESLCILYELFTRPLRVFGCDSELTTKEMQQEIRVVHPVRLGNLRLSAEPDFVPERIRT